MDDNTHLLFAALMHGATFLVVVGFALGFAAHRRWTYALAMAAVALHVFTSKPDATIHSLYGMDGKVMEVSRGTR